MNTKIIVVGANGRMGKNIIQVIEQDSQTTLVGATEAPSSPALGQEIVSGVVITEDLSSIIKNNKGVVIDFTVPAVSMQNVEAVVQNQGALVIGTTGFDKDQLQKIKEAAKKAPILLAPNMSTGVNLALGLVAQAAKILGKSSSIEVFEAHHEHKKDAPSGTAKKIAEVLSSVTGLSCSDELVYGCKDENSDCPKNQINMRVLREGEIVGEHVVSFRNKEERLEIRHVATDRMVFASGAVKAAKWLKDQPPGFYDMQDVLGI